MSEFPETQYATSDGLSIAYQVWGDGPRDLVVVPGIISHLEERLNSPEYVRWIRALSAFCRVVIFDKRGNGMSDRIMGAPTLDERASDIQAVMDAAGVEKAALAGFSEGGIISMVFAARHPERVSKLVTGGSGAQGRVASGEQTPEQFDNVSEQLRENWGQVGGVHQFSSFGPGPEDPEGQIEFARFCRMSATPATIVALNTMSSHMDVSDVLPSIHQPTLVIRREGEATSRTRAMFVAEHIPNATYMELPGDEHTVYRGDSDAYVRAIRDFLVDKADVITPPASSKRLLASVLFTDLVGSTESQARLGDASYRELMNRHDDLAQRQIQRHNGRFVNSTGDGLMATFDAPSNAIACAAAIRDGLSSMDLQIRAGVHTGEIEQRGDDISGISVNIASRITDLADSGEIYTSDLTRQLMIGADVRFESRGDHELKGVPGTWPLFAASLS
jgi:class 3 adenylate cyclase